MTESGSGMNLVSAIQSEKYDCDLAWLWPLPLSMNVAGAIFIKHCLTQRESCTFSMKVANATFIKQCVTLRGHARFH